MKKLMVCVDLTDRSIDLYKKQLKEWNWDEWDEVHFVHGFRSQVYADNFYFSAFPTELQVGSIEESVQSVLDGLGSYFVDGGFKGKVVCKCIVSHNPKGSLRNYADENDIYQMLIETRGKHGLEGLFSSSFAEFMVRHAPCRVLVLRDDKRE